LAAGESSRRWEDLGLLPNSATVIVRIGANSVRSAPELVAVCQLQFQAAAKMLQAVRMVPD